MHNPGAFAMVAWETMCTRIVLTRDLAHIVVGDTSLCCVLIVLVRILLIRGYVLLMPLVAPRAGEMLTFLLQYAPHHVGLDGLTEIGFPDLQDLVEVLQIRCMLLLTPGPIGINLLLTFLLLLGTEVHLGAGLLLGVESTLTRMRAPQPIFTNPPAPQIQFFYLPQLLVCMINLELPIQHVHFWILGQWAV